MSKSRRRVQGKIPKGLVEHKAHRRNVKHKLKLGMFEHLPEAPRKSGVDRCPRDEG
jgi:hypothetical protein